MKIVHVSGYYPPHMGGIEECAKNIVEQLAARGHEVRVLTSAVGSKPRIVRRKKSLTEEYLAGFEFGHTPFIPALLPKLWALPHDTMVHIHLSHVFTEVSVWAVRKLRRRPYVAHFHMDVDVSGPLGFLFLWYKRLVLPFVIRGAHKIITLSEEQRQLVISRYKARPENVVVIPNGVADPFFIKRAKQFKHKPLKLLYVGRFAKQKNIPRMLKALAKVKQPLELHLVGDGEKRPEIERLISELQLKNVTLHGRLVGARNVAQFHDADAFIMTSDREGMPLVIVEAAAAGLPIIASDVQGLREFIGSIGVLVSPPTEAKFAKAIDKTMSDSVKLKALSAGGRKWAEDYRWSTLVSTVEQLYEEVHRAN